MNGKLETIDGRPALRFERRLNHPIERVWRAVTEPAELATWFVGTVEWQPALGERFEAAGEAGEITALEPPHVLAWTWGVQHFRFELSPDDAGCLLTFTHVFDPQLGAPAQHAAGWDGYLDRLDAHLDGADLSEEDAHGPIGEAHERYARQFGDDPEPGRRMIAGMGFRGLTLEDGPALRLERRFRHPSDRVWRALTDPDELTAWFPEIDALEVIETDPPRMLAVTWFGDPMRFELHAEGDDACRLVFTQSFEDRDTAARTAAGWDRCFARFDALLAGHPMSERDSLTLWPDVHERYAADFGVDPELGRKAFANHPLS